MNRNKAIVPLHHRKEGWPSDSKKSEASTDREAGVVFRMKTKRKTTPAASALVASRNFLMTQPALLAVMQGGDYWLHSNLFTASTTAHRSAAGRKQRAAFQFRWRQGRKHRRSFG